MRKFQKNLITTSQVIIPRLLTDKIYLAYIIVNPTITNIIDIFSVNGEKIDNNSIDYMELYRDLEHFEFKVIEKKFFNRDLTIISLVSDILDLSFLNNSGLHFDSLKTLDITRLNYLLEREKKTQLTKKRFKAIDTLHKNKDNSELIDSVFAITEGVTK